ncbi:MAG TPA: lyase family protein, partial [Patescibacteria group bacterium]|nr:lyase family protein [Patescibacteria group bacterium]
EPFPKGKRGSSAMPHKRNPNRLEQLRGMAEELVGYQTIMTLAIQTDDERAIDQSCQERINWPDAFALVAHMLTSLTKIVAGIEFFPEQMLANIAKIKGLHGSSYVKDLLLDKGITHLDFDGEEVQTYKWVQGCAFEAWQRQVELTDVLRERGIDNLVDPDELTVCFDPWRGLRHVPVIYERFGI